MAKKCTECKGELKELTDVTPEGFEYRYFKCQKCGEEIVDMKQLHDVAEKYREMKKFNAKLTKWGASIGLRIPKELVKKYNFKADKEVSLIPEKDSIRLVVT